MPGKNQAWIGLGDRLELLDLDTEKPIQSLPLPHGAKGPVWSVAMASAGRPLYVTFCGVRFSWAWCAELAKLNQANGKVLGERYLGYFFA